MKPKTQIDLVQASTALTLVAQSQISRETLSYYLEK